MLMRLELGTIKVAKGHDEWAAAIILLIPYAGAIVLLSAPGVGFGGLLVLVVAFGVPASGARIRLARYLRDRRRPQGVSEGAEEIPSLK